MREIERKGGGGGGIKKWVFILSIYNIKLKHG